MALLNRFTRFFEKNRYGVWSYHDACARRGMDSDAWLGVLCVQFYWSMRPVTQFHSNL
jgi:hypothetical protein